MSKEAGFLVVQYQKECLGKIDFDTFQTLLISSPSCTLSTPLLQELAERNIVVILCDQHYLPTSLLTPYYQHQQSMTHTLLQAQLHGTTKKRLWQQIVQEKLKHQAMVLQAFQRREAEHLWGLSKNVALGDPDNKEAQGARLYFSALFGREFRRSDDRDVKNHCLNYGYTLLRSAMVRAILVSGLHPSLSVKHSGERNPYCLADDFMEPFRPLTDAAVFLFFREEREITPRIKAQLSRILGLSLACRSLKCYSPVAQSMQYMAYSFVRVLKKEIKELQIPHIGQDIEKWLKNTMAI